MANKTNLDNSENIFKIDHSKCNGNWEDCIPVKRLLAALKHYSVSDEDIFCDFIDEVYNVQMLEDYSHFITQHDDDLYAINEYWIKNGGVCSVATCSFASRHHRQKKRKTENEKFGFYAETMDSLHYYFVHLFECGMRVKENEQIAENEHDINETAYFDSAFARVVQRVNNRRQNIQNFDRFKSVSKFSLDNDNDSNTTFLEEVKKKLSNKSFLDVAENEEFDSDSIKMDIMHAKTNLFQILSKEKKINLIKEFIVSLKMQNNTFSVGYRFFYWPKYENLEKEETNSSNIINYGGYKATELYVTKKFNDFKQEIMSYSNITMKGYKKIMAKATIYLQTETAKKIKAKINMYDITIDTLLCVWNLIALILYTDYSAHCSEFNASFRKLSPFESLQVTKERNRNFWWMAKTLRESVEIFGKCRDDGRKKRDDGMFGPFYTGLNRKMVISQFNIRLNAPTSTTKHLSVAVRFGGSDGTIVKLNNDSTHHRADPLRGFNVSWLSKYKEESERLFIGGYHRMRLQSIRLTKTKQNFENLISSLYYLDAMITGKDFYGFRFKTDENAKEVIKDLFEYGLGNKRDHKMDKYIYECFDAFVKNKQSLNIHSKHLNGAKEFMYQLIVHSLMLHNPVRCESDKINLIRSELVLIFPNVTNVHLDANYYPFSLFSFLSVLKASNWQKVTIQGKWISKQLQSSIIGQYADCNYTIKYEERERVATIEKFD